MKIYGGPISRGRQIFPGFMLGSEGVVPGPGNSAGVSGWMNLIVPTQPDRKAADFNLAEGTMRYLVHTPPQPNYDYRSFDFDRDTGMLDAWGQLVNATNTDLSRFRKRGGKLIMTYGWADTVLQPMVGVDYFEQAVARNGPDTPEFFRLFMVPGMGHCGGWRRDGSIRRGDCAGGLGRKGQGARCDSCRPRGQQPGGAFAAAVRVSAGGALRGAGQHGRGRELPLRQSKKLI